MTFGADFAEGGDGARAVRARDRALLAREHPRRLPPLARRDAVRVDRRRRRRRPGAGARDHPVEPARRRLDERRRRRRSCSPRTSSSSARASRRSGPASRASPPDDASSRPRASPVETALVLLGATLFVCALMWPVVRHFSSTIIGSPGSDSTGIGLVLLDAAARERLPPARQHAPHAERRTVRLGPGERAEHPVVASVLPGVSRDQVVRPGRGVQPRHARRLRPVRRLDVPARAVPPLQPPRGRVGRASSSSSSPGTSRAPSTPR